MFASTGAALKGRERVLAPAVGLLAACAPHVGSNAWEAGSVVAKEVMARPRREEAAVLARSRSVAAAHLTPKRLGVVVGLALVGAADATCTRKLNEVGIATNKVDGEWSGVSLSRFKRLVEVVGKAWHDDEDDVALTLVARTAWERARSKSELAEYLLALHSIAPVLSEEGVSFLTSGEFDKASFGETLASVDELDADGVLEDMLRTADADPLHVERLAAAVSSSLAFKPTTHVSRHTFSGGGKPVNDCVEVAVREVIEYALFDPVQRSFQPERLPPSSRAWLRSLYSAATTAPPDEKTVSKTYFDECQGLDGAEYLSRAPSSGAPYELAPSARNLFLVLGKLLSASSSTSASKSTLAREWSQPEDVQAVWPHLTIRQRSDRVRSAIDEEVKNKEVLEFESWSSPVTLVVTLERAHRLATCTHRLRRFPHSNSGEADDTARVTRMATRRRSLAEAWAQRDSASWVDACVLPLLAGEGAMLEALAPRTASSGKVALAVLGTKWGADRSRWMPFERDAQPTEEMDAAEKRVEAVLVQRAVKLLQARGGGGQGQALLRSLLSGASRECVSSPRFAALLASSFPRDALSSVAPDMDPTVASLLSLPVPRSVELGVSSRASFASWRLLGRVGVL